MQIIHVHQLWFYVVLVFLLIMFNLNLVWCGTVVDNLEFCKFKRTGQEIPKCIGLEYYQPWSYDEICKIYHVKLLPKGTLKPTAITGSSFVGLSWFQEIIERSSGIVTGSVTFYIPNSNPTSQIKCGLKAGDGRTLVQETQDAVYHMLPYWYKKMMSNDDEEEMNWPKLSKTLFNYRGILLVRNPWNTLIITREYIRDSLRKCSTCKQLPLHRSKEMDFEEKDFQKYLENGATEWVKHIKAWLNGSPNPSGILIVQYEKLIQSPESELRRVLKYLNTTVEEERLDCALKDPSIIDVHLSTSGLISKVANFFQDNNDSKATSILESGLNEINELIRLNKLGDYLDYKRPTHTDILTEREAFTSRINLE